VASGTDERKLAGHILYFLDHPGANLLAKRTALLTVSCMSIKTTWHRQSAIWPISVPWPTA
jgi:hypothetical protein